MNEQFVIKNLMDAKDCPHIPMRIFFQFSNHIKTLNPYFTEKEWIKIIENFMSVSQKLFHLHGIVKNFYEELGKIVKQMDDELGKRDSSMTMQYEDNSEKIFNIFSDFLLNWQRVLKHTSILFWIITGHEDIQTTKKMDSYLRSTKNKNTVKMLDEDLHWAVRLNDLRNEIEHLENNVLSFLWYDIEYHKDKKPLLKLPRFDYKKEGEIQLSDYIKPTYINIFTFVEDIIAIWINEKIWEGPLWLFKTIDDNWDLNSVESTYTLNMLEIPS